MHIADMHIINLTVKCKHATGDGTKIVCMNEDYFVRVTAEDCGTFTNAPIKKLIVRHDREYYESDIVEVTHDGETFIGAKLPPLERNGYVDLGICGKNSENVIIYTSTSARFECDKSALTGVVVKKTDPVLRTLNVTENGTYNAPDSEADGFYRVDVQVTAKTEENKTVSLSMANGNQVIEPSANATMRKVEIVKPSTLTPENIKKDIVIGGVTGSYERKLMEKTVYADGKYTPDEGFAGFYAVVVESGKSRFDRVLRKDEYFTHEYTSKVNVTVDTPDIVKYENTGRKIIVTALALGSCAVTIEDLDEDNNVVNTTHYIVYVVDATSPAQGTYSITQSGKYNVSDYMWADVNIPQPRAEIVDNVLRIIQ